MQRWSATISPSTTLPTPAPVSRSPIQPGRPSIRSSTESVVLEGIVGRGDHDAQVDAHPGRRVGDGRSGRDADPEDIRRRHLVRFLTLKPIAFEEPGSYFQRYATIRDGIAVTAAEVQEGVNLVNLRESIAPTRERATLALREDARHRMRRVLLRKA